jgi:hypothetical protein
MELTRGWLGVFDFVMSSSEGAVLLVVRFEDCTGFVCGVCIGVEELNRGLVK